MKHVLVIGGSGMLSGVVKWLSEACYSVSVVGRTKKKMRNVLVHKNVKPIYVDYQNSINLNEAVKNHISVYGAFDVVVAWIHSSGKYVLHEVMRTITIHKNNIPLYHIIGSSSNLERVKNEASAPVNCIYHQIQLGYISTASKNRWLTHKEISEGVIQAIKHQKRTFTIGTVDNWENRP